MFSKSKTEKRLFRSRSMFSRILPPVMSILILQAVLYSVLFWRGSIINRIEENAFNIFSEHSRNAQQRMQSDMQHIALRLADNEALVAETIDNILAQNKKTPADVASDYELNQKIVSSVSNLAVNFLKRNSVNGFFLVLDGPTTPRLNNSEFSRAGLYIRNIDTNTTSSNNSDLLLERGMPNISKNLNISLDTYWSAGFDLLASEPQSSDFFFKPLNAARQYSGVGEASYYGRWTGCFPMSKDEINVLTYSIPLIAKDKTVIGVIGIDLTERQLMSQMPYAMLEPNLNAAYFLGVSTDGGKTYHRAVTNGPIYKYHFGSADSIEIAEENYPNVYTVYEPDGCKFFAALHKFDFYNTNTPFENEQWALIGLEEQDVLFYYSKQVTMAATLSLLISLLMGIVGVIFITHIFSSHMTALIKNLRQSSPTGRIQLQKLGIDEIDELTISIENLSNAVAGTAEKIAKVFSLAPVSIGIFEYDRLSSKVFCSSNLFELLGWKECKDNTYFYLSRHEFERRMFAIDPNLLKQSNMQFSISSLNGSIKWLRADTIEQDGKILGAISDITADIIAKHRIEYERDYDPLTNLYNIRAFNKCFSSLLSDNKMATAALIMWDLDNLKHINDTFGHDFGDRYIKAFAECLEGFMRHSSLVARRSGDEFYSLIYGYSSNEEISKIVNEILSIIEQKFIVLPNGEEYRVRVSGGLAWYPDDASNGEDLLRFADFAMYHAKHELKGRIKEFNKRAYLENAHIIDGYEVVTRFIENELVKFAMQPIVSVKNGEIFGYEMLMRPQIPGGYTPSDIIRMAQTHSKLYPIERISLFNGMKTFMEMMKNGQIGKNERVFLNSISSQMLTDDDLLMFEAQYGDYLKRIVIEITEGEQDSNEYGKSKLDLVHRWGAMIATDDYGSGYNSEAMLVYLSPDIVKIDMSILRGIDKDPNRQNILEAIVTYAKKRNVATLAEGIETEAELRTVISYEVDYIQGYYTGKPSFSAAPIPSDVLDVIADAVGQQKL